MIHVFSLGCDSDMLAPTEVPIKASTQNLIELL